VFAKPDAHNLRSTRGEVRAAVSLTTRSDAKSKFPRARVVFALRQEGSAARAAAKEDGEVEDEEEERILAGAQQNVLASCAATQPAVRLQARVLRANHTKAAIHHSRHSSAQRSQVRARDLALN
jgi:hypothetical protein